MNRKITERFENEPVKDIERKIKVVIKWLMAYKY